MISGLLLYSLSAWAGSRFPDPAAHIDTDLVPWAYFIFLVGCFLMGTFAAMLQVVINPYIAAYDLPGTTAVQRMNISTGCNSIGTTIGPFFVTGIIFAGVALSEVKPGQLILPILAIAAIVALAYLLTAKSHLPDLADTRSSAQLPRSVWSFSHLALGATTIFLYVGAEVSIGVNINLHALQMIENGQSLTFFGNANISFGNLNLGIQALLATLYWGGMMVGRLVCSAFPALPPNRLLAGVAIGAALLVLCAMVTDNLYILSAVGLCHSVMWICVFTLAIAGLGLYTSRASGTFMMGVFGGAVFPLLQGMLADSLGSWRWTWIVVLFWELAIFY